MTKIRSLINVMVHLRWRGGTEVAVAVFLGGRHSSSPQVPVPVCTNADVSRGEPFQKRWVPCFSQLYSRVCRPGMPCRAIQECQNSMGDSALRLSVVSRNPISSELPRAKKGSAGSSLCSICDHMVPTALCCERESRSRLTAALSTHGFRL